MGRDSLVFKRYGETEEDARKELESFLKERYDTPAQIVDIEKDKTHPFKKKTAEVKHD